MQRTSIYHSAAKHITVRLSLTMRHPIILLHFIPICNIELEHFPSKLFVIHSNNAFYNRSRSCEALREGKFFMISNFINCNFNSTKRTIARNSRTCIIVDYHYLEDESAESDGV